VYHFLDAGLVWGLKLPHGEVYYLPIYQTGCVVGPIEFCNEVLRDFNTTEDLDAIHASRLA